MKILVIGATGTIGKAVVEELAPRHDIVTVGLTSGDIQVDLTDAKAIEAMYSQASGLDGVVMTTGRVHFKEVSQMQAEDYQFGLQDKLMIQVNVVLQGLQHLNANGSFTLTSGILNQDPIRYGSSAAMVNGAIDGFVKAAALELPNGLRINAVSPTVIAEAMADYAPYFRGFDPIPAAKAALGYSKSVEGLQTGQIYQLF